MNQKKTLFDEGVKVGQLILMIATIVGFFVTLGWEAYGEDKVENIIDLKLTPIEDQIKELQGEVKGIKHDIELGKYSDHQQLFLLKKIAGNKAVAEMLEETEIFKPDEN